MEVHGCHPCTLKSVPGKGRMFNNTTEEKLERVTSLFNELYPEFQDFVLRQIDELIELQNIQHEKQ